MENNRVGCYQAPYDRELALDEFRMGDAFQAIGYATGYIGKWHLGGEPFEPEFPRGN